MWQDFFHVGWQLLSISSSFLRIIVFGRALEAAEVTGRGWGWGRGTAEAVRLMMVVSSSFEEEERRKITACQCHILLRTKKPDCYSLLSGGRLLWRLQRGRHTFRQSVTQWSKIHNPVQKLSSFVEEERRKITTCQCHILLMTKKPDCYSLLPVPKMVEAALTTPTWPSNFLPVSHTVILNS